MVAMQTPLRRSRHDCLCFQGHHCQKVDRLLPSADAVAATTDSAEQLTSDQILNCYKNMFYISHAHTNTYWVLYLCPVCCFELGFLVLQQ